MKLKVHAFDWLALVLMISPFLYLVYAYPRLPDSVATHYDFQGSPNGYTQKSDLWQILLLLGVISVGVYLLIRFLPQIDPKKWAKYSTGAYNKIAVTVAVLQSTLSMLIIYMALHGASEMIRVLPVVLGIFFAILGNFMHNIKPNYFLGIRTPWTLESEETWRKTHQLAGKLWFAGGLIIAGASLLLPVAFANFLMIGGVVLLALIPSVYSYICFRSLQKHA